MSRNNLIRAALLAGSLAAPVASGAQDQPTQIRIRTNTHSVAATMDDNPATRDFLAMLPLTLSLSDFAQTEKISDLPGRLSTQDAPEGFTPVAGDVAYYAPWGNLAIFHKPFRYSPGLIKLGHISDGLEALRQSGPLEVTIERQ